MPFIDANGVSLHYDLAGPRGRSVVLMHELGGTLNSWDAVAPRLAGRCRVLRYDQRGAGLSEKVRQEFYQRHAGGGFRGARPQRQASIRPIISSPSLRRRPRRCASWKSIPIGSARWCCAIRRPVSIQAVPRRSTSVRPLPRARACVLRCRRRSRMSYPPTLGERAAYEAYLGRYLATIRCASALAFRALARTNMLHMLPLIRCPAMVVAGRHDTVRPHAGTAELAKKIPGARFELIEGRPFHADAGTAGARRFAARFLPK